MTARLVAGALLTLGALLTAGCSPPPAARTGPRTGVVVLDADGLSAFVNERDSRYTVINFWATWCVPCVEEMPLLVAAAEKWTTRGVGFVGVSCDLLTGGEVEEKRIVVEEFAHRYAPGFVHVLFTGDEDDLLQLFDHPGPLPYTAILADSGENVWNHVGILEPGQLEKALESLPGLAR